MWYYLGCGDKRVQFLNIPTLVLAYDDALNSVMCCATLDYLLKFSEFLCH